MNDRLDLERTVTDWLQAGAPSRAPEAVLALALDRVAGARQEHPFGGRRFDEWIGRSPRPRTRFVLLLAMTGVLALLGVAAAFVGSQHTVEPPSGVVEPPSRVVEPPSGVVSNGWIAYSTGGQLPGSTDRSTGSDIYVVRAGVEPRLIAGREGGTTRNVCPAFSPDGRRLAFGVESKQGRSIDVLSVDPTGATSDPVRIAVPGSGPGPCVRWSSDGARVGYLDGGTVVIRGLDGSTPASVAGDPRRAEFPLESSESETLASPKGDRVASRNPQDGAITIASQDGTGAHPISPLGFSPYAFPAWSPDGRQILVMVDVGGAFSMYAIPVDVPVDILTVASDVVVSGVGVNGERSWPGRGDVSWQPLFP